MIDLATVTRLDADAQRRVITAQIRGAVTDDAPEDAEEHDEVEVLQPAGLLARPELTATTEAAVVMRGDEPVVILLIDKGATAQTPEAGEVRLHGVAAASATAVVRIRANGSIEITAASGQDVVVNGGSLKVARDTDPVNRTTAMGTWMTQVQAAVNGLAPGSVTPFVGGVVGAVADGAAHFKG